MNLQAVSVPFYILVLFILWLIIVVGDDKKLVCTHCQLNDLIFLL